MRCPSELCVSGMDRRDVARPEGFADQARRAFQDIVLSCVQFFRPLNDRATTVLDTTGRRRVSSAFWSYANVRFGADRGSAFGQ
jgi:hypothetical protein